MGNFKKGFVLLASAGIILMLSYYLLSVTLNIPYIGLSVEKSESGIWQISDVDHLGWAEQQGIKVGDIVSLINEIQPSGYFTILKYGVIEQAETLVINKNGELILHKVTTNMTPEQVQYEVVIPTLVFVILFIFSSYYTLVNAFGITLANRIISNWGALTAALASGGYSAVLFLLLDWQIVGAAVIIGGIA